MQYWPITPEQEQELQERAIRYRDSKGIKGVPEEHKAGWIASMLGGFVFNDGRLTENVYWETRLRIAEEVLQQD